MNNKHLSTLLTTITTLSTIQIYSMPLLDHETTLEEMGKVRDIF